MTVTVLTACYGGYDTLVSPPSQSVECRWVAVTDGTCNVPEPWEQIVEPRGHMHPRLAAKVPKCLPYLYAWGPVVWLDASAWLKTGDTIERLVAAAGDAYLAQWEHPDRKAITGEAAVSAMMRKYEGQPVREQAAQYVAQGHPDSWGLWATGAMVWPDPKVLRGFGEAWLAEQVRWTYQDQISEPYVLRQWGVNVAAIPGNLWRNDMIGWGRHTRDD